MCHFLSDKIKKILSILYTNVVFSHVIPPRREQGNYEPDDDNCTKMEKNGRIFYIPAGKVVENYHMFYIGTESFTLTNLMVTLNKCLFSTYSPETGVARRETMSVNKALMRRYYLVEKARDAKIVGIVVGTLGVSDYMTVIQHLKNIIKRAGKKYYTLVVGKVNPAKLANFMEVDVFTLVACPENTLIDSKEFYKPVVTPFEMEIACNAARNWTGDYVTDFREILPGELEAALVVTFVSLQ